MSTKSKSLVTSLFLAASTIVSVGSLSAAPAFAGAAVTAGDRRVPPAFTVEFTSIGTGINSAAYEFLVAALQEKLATGELREYTLSPYGREGERKVCFALAEPGAAFQIVQNLQASGLSDDRIVYSGAASCVTKASKPSRR